MESLSPRTTAIPTGPAFSPRRGVMSWVSGKELSRQFWVFFAAAFCFDFGFAMFFFLFNLFLLDYGFTEKPLGLITAAMTIGGVAGTIPVGMLARKFGFHRLLLFGFILAPTVSAMRTFIVSQSAQIGLAFLTGICFCFWTVCFSPAAAKLTTEKNRAFAFSLLFSVGIGSGALGGIIGGYLPGWLQTMGSSIHSTDAKRLVLLSACLIVALGTWPISRLRVQSDPERQVRSRLFNPFLLRFLPAVAVWALVLGSFTPFANVYLSRHIQIPLSHIGLVFSASHIAQVAAVLVAPIVFRKFGVVTGITYTQIATAIALVFLAKLHNVSLVICVYLGFTAAQWMSSPGIYSLLMSRVPEEERSGASASNIFVMSLFQAGASALAGSSLAKFGYPIVLSAVAGVALFAALLFRTLLGHSNGPVDIEQYKAHL